MPAAIGFALFGPPGLLGAVLGVAAFAFLSPGSRTTYQRAMRYVLRSHAPPNGTLCGRCEQAFHPLEPAFSSIESGTFVHARCRKRHAHQPHQELIAG